MSKQANRTEPQTTVTRLTEHERIRPIRNPKPNQACYFCQNIITPPSRTVGVLDGWHRLWESCPECAENVVKR